MRADRHRSQGRHRREFAQQRVLVGPLGAVAAPQHLDLVRVHHPEDAADGTRPGGILVIGVPIFFPPLDLARKYLVPRLAGILRHPDTASHLQAFSLFSFLRLLKAHPGLSVVKARGFRIISGGLLRPLENYRWWWQLNTRLGQLLPALCIEVQIILRKSPARG